MEYVDLLKEDIEALERLLNELETESSAPTNQDFGSDIAAAIEDFNICNEWN